MDYFPARTADIFPAPARMASIFIYRGMGRSALCRSGLGDSLAGQIRQSANRRPDYKRAKRDRLMALVIWLPALALELLFLVLRPVSR